MNGGSNALPSFAPRIRVEVYIPVRYESPYQDTFAWLIREFTELRGGCTVIENAGGYYLSTSNEIIDDRVNVVYCDFPMDWNKRNDRGEVTKYCAGLERFLMENLSEEAVLIATYPISHSNALE